MDAIAKLQGEVAKLSYRVEQLERRTGIHTPTEIQRPKEPSPMKIYNNEGKWKDKLPMGSTVRTTKGGREYGTFYGEVIGYGKWKNYFDVKVRKHNGKIVMCHAVNLVRVKY